MPSCVLLNDPYTESSKEVDNVDLNCTVDEFRKVVAQHTGLLPEQQDLIFLGECLEDSSSPLSFYGIKDNGTIFVLKKPEKTIDNQVPLYTVALEEVNQYLSKAKNPIYAQSIRKYIKVNENIEKVIKENEAIKKDPTISNLLRDPDLLLSIIETATGESITKEYPLLALALQLIIPKASGPLVGNLTVDSDEDDSEYDGIDLSQLAQAEAMTGVQQSSNAQSQNNQISAVDLANALSFATMTQPGSGTANAQSTSMIESQMESSLEQMRAVGIVDDNVSRRALIITQGNVEAAINLIFEGNLS